MTGPTDFFPPVARWRVPESVLDDSYDEMARDGRRGTEGIALWAGRRAASETAEITHLLVLRGSGVRRRREAIQIAPALLNDVTDVLESLDAALVGQIHSHAPEYGVGLSSTDRYHGIKVPYYLSIVAPDFAMHSPQIEEWGVYVSDPAAGWRRVTIATAALDVVPSARVPVLIVGGR